MLLAYEHAGDQKTMPSQSDPLIQKLIDQLRHPEAITRRNAAGALRLHGRRAVIAIPKIEPLLNDRDARVRQEADHALRRLNDAAA